MRIVFEILLGLGAFYAGRVSMWPTILTYRRGVEGALKSVKEMRETSEPATTG